MTPRDPLTDPIPKRDVVLPPPDLGVSPPRADLDLRPMSEPEKPSVVDRIRSVWEVVQKLVEEAVQAAEVLHPGSGQGPNKKEWVKERVMTFLRSLEARENFVPGFVEGLVFKAVETALDWMIDRVVRELTERGLVNRGKPA